MIELDLDRGALLAEAVDRATRRRDLAATRERMGGAAAELAECLRAATDCVEALARPAAALLALGRGEPWLDAEGPAQACLLTCGYDSRRALAWLDGDYTRYHLQDAMARELVFALGREAARRIRAANPGLRFVRRALPGGAQQPVLARFGGAMGVTALPSGALAPLHSLLGLMVAMPAADAQIQTPLPPPAAGALLHPQSPP